tara:strand:- start:252 stop:512 length:261 start_codon:yes stop_codon:yes gene_type:complete
MKKIITKIQFKITDWLYRKRIIFPQLLENKNIHVLDTVTLDNVYLEYVSQTTKEINEMKIYGSVLNKNEFVNELTNDKLFANKWLR